METEEVGNQGDKSGYRKRRQATGDSFAQPGLAGKSTDWIRHVRQRLRNDAKSRCGKRYANGGRGVPRRKKKTGCPFPNSPFQSIQNHVRQHRHASRVWVRSAVTAGRGCCPSACLIPSSQSLWPFQAGWEDGLAARCRYASVEGVAPFEIASRMVDVFQHALRGQELGSSFPPGGMVRIPQSIALSYRVS